jgi:hypothetical protein
MSVVGEALGGGVGATGSTIVHVNTLLTESDPSEAVAVT